MKATWDPWEAILSTIEPDWQTMKDALNTGPTIRPKLFKKNRRWHIILIEIWPDIIQWQGGSGKLDASVEWCVEVLEIWKDCKRESWDTWSFDSKKNAEKFITYYNIACPQ